MFFVGGTLFDRSVRLQATDHGIMRSHQAVCLVVINPVAAQCADRRGCPRYPRCAGYLAAEANESGAMFGVFYQSDLLGRWLN